MMQTTTTKGGGILIPDERLSTMILRRSLFFGGLLARILGLGLVANCVLAEDAPARATVDLEAAFTRQVQPFLRQHCIRCHNGEDMVSGVRVDHLDASVEDRWLKLWEGIRRQVVGQQMPPKDEPQPTETERQAMDTWIQQALLLARSRPTPKNGSLRRLTVAQYRNT